MTAESPPARAPSGVVRSVVRTILWPLRRFFDPRFTGVHDAFEDVKRVVIADMDANNQVATLTGRTLDAVLERVEDVHRRLAFDPEAPHSLAELDDALARILNFGSSHRGFAAQANLWFNPPILVAYEERNVGVRWVNERIVEVPYAFRALARVPPNAKVLDVGATESTVCLSLATLGYDVTAIDPRPNPLSHERLNAVVGGIEEWQPDAEFDAVLCLSTIEHLGTGEYGLETSERRVDLEAMRRMHELTKPGGVLVLTTAVGRASRDGSSRVYDRQGLDELLAGWNVDDLTLVQRRAATSWVTLDDSIDALDAGAETVAMITATRTG